MSERNPYRIEGPALISFSGGRTSAYMLRRFLDAWHGAPPPDVHVMFANTGKERPETLRFVALCAHHWDVPVRWVEYGRDNVTFETASRNGEPFAALIEKRKFLPNAVARFCTSELKIRPMMAVMKACGYDRWDSVIGLRADEPARVAKRRAANDANKERWESVMPLAEAGVTKRDVMAFWADNQQGFDLGLNQIEGNCDLCFLKGASKLIRIMEERPSLAEWWAAQERATGGTFRKRTSYAAMQEMVAAQTVIDFDAVDDQLTDCFCHD